MISKGRRGCCHAVWTFLEANEKGHNQPETNNHTIGTRTMQCFCDSKRKKLVCTSTVRSFSFVRSFLYFSLFGCQTINREEPWFESFNLFQFWTTPTALFEFLEAHEPHLLESPNTVFDRQTKYPLHLQDWTQKWRDTPIGSVARTF